MSVVYILEVIEHSVVLYKWNHKTCPWSRHLRSYGRSMIHILEVMRQLCDQCRCIFYIPEVIAQDMSMIYIPEVIRQFYGP